jgi:hypothetical protein
MEHVSQDSVLMSELDELDSEPSDDLLDGLGFAWDDELDFVLY